MKKENRPYGTGRLYARVMAVIGVLLIFAAIGIVFLAFILSQHPPGNPPSGMSHSTYILLMSLLSYWTAFSLFITGVLTVVGSEYLMAVFDNTYYNREILWTLRERDGGSA